MLDNAADTAQVQLLLPAGRECAAIVTSRRALTTLDSAELIELTALTTPQAQELLARIAGAARVSADPAATSQIIGRCGHLPLALRIAAARLAARPHLPVAWLADRLADTHRLDQLEHDDLAVRTSIAVSRHELDADAGHMFDLLGHPDIPDITAPAAAALANWPEERAAHALESLVDARLLDTLQPGRYRMHDLVRLYAREQAPHRHDPMHRLLDWYLASALNVAATTSGREMHRYAFLDISASGTGATISGTQEAVAWVDAERANLLALMRQSTSLGPDCRRVACGVISTIWPVYWTWGLWGDLDELARIAMAAAHDLGDPRQEAVITLVQAKTLLGQDRLDEACDLLAKTETRWRRLDDKNGLAATYSVLSCAHRQAGDLSRSEDACKLGVEASREAGNRALEASNLSSLGLTDRRQGRVSDAFEAMERAFALAHGVDDPHLLLVCMTNLAETYRIAGRLDRAISFFHEAIATAESGHEYVMAEVHWGLGQALATLGEHGEARANWRRSVAMLQDLGHMTPEEACEVLADPIKRTPAAIVRTT